MNQGAHKVYAYKECKQSKGYEKQNDTQSKRSWLIWLGTLDTGLVAASGEETDEADEGGGKDEGEVAPAAFVDCPFLTPSENAHIAFYQRRKGEYKK